MIRRFTQLLKITGLMTFMVWTGNPALGQGTQTLKLTEDTLTAILTRINRSTDDSTKQKLNSSFYHILHEALMDPEADNHPFLSLKSLVKITSPDNKFIIYHWNLPDSKGNHNYYGFIKLLNRDPSLVFSLNDFSDSIPKPDTAHLDCMHWFGALYYKVILNETKSGKQFYTLLGWSGKNAAITQKIIEILSFNDRGIPEFGLPLFHDYNGGKMTRIIFRYSGSTSMSLKYEEQMIASDKKWNPKKREFEFRTRTAMMIVFDRMVPLDPKLEGQFQYYVAAGDVFDGFECKNGGWNFIQGIDSRNKK
jgi:hypothetical protein